MLSIRLSRGGKKKQPVYRVVVLDNRKDPWGDYIENFGTYNPTKNPKEVDLKADRIKYWLNVGAQPSETVHNLLVDAKIIDKPKVRATSPKTNSKKAPKKSEVATETKTEAPVIEAKPSSVEVPEDKKEEAAATAPESKESETNK